MLIGIFVLLGLILGAGILLIGLHIERIEGRADERHRHGLLTGEGDFFISSAGPVKPRRIWLDGKLIYEADDEWVEVIDG